MILLDKYCRKKRPDFVVVAGDNYYPEKIVVKTAEGKDKRKIIHPADLDSGFDCLPKNVPVDVIFGNHDLETNTPDQSNVYIDGKLEHGCYILNRELKQHAPHMEIAFHKTRRIGPTLICMIDTTIFTSDYSGSKECYGQLHPNKSQSDIIAMQLEQIRTAAMEPGVKHMILIGHHPIAALKNKEGKTRHIYPSESFVDFLSDVYAVLKNRVGYYYLCADVHSYHVSTVRIGDMHIRQYIAGIGGASLDDPPPTLDSYDTVISGKPVRYEPKGAYEQINGFLEITGSDVLSFRLFKTEGGTKDVSRKTRSKSRTRSRSGKSRSISRKTRSL
jgi:hypothetical protein